MLVLGIIVVLGPTYQSTNAQKVKVQKIGAYSESDYFVENGVLYSAMIKIGFRQKLIDPPRGVAAIEEEQIPAEFSFFKAQLAEIRRHWGGFRILKSFPQSVWSDSLKPNRQTGALVRVKDQSQLFRLLFDRPIPIDSVRQELQAVPQIEYVSPPTVFVDYSSPNDPAYSQQWELQAVQAPKAWDITKGDSSIMLAVVDWGQLGNSDLNGKIVGGDSLSYCCGDHGTRVAGVLAARTDNSFGISSLGWNLHILTYFGGYINDYSTKASQIEAAYLAGARVINMSWGIGVYSRYDNCEHDYGDSVVFRPQDDAEVFTTVTNIQRSGTTICVAAYGNRSENYALGISPPSCDPCKIPYSPYPAQYATIAVSGTKQSGSTEDSIYGYNYGSSVKIAAPSWSVTVLQSQSPYFTQDYGTSFGAPQVSALVGLMFALNPNLTSDDILTTLTLTADKVGTIPYSQGRNDFLGFGRINAYAALKYTIEHYSTTIGGAGTTVVLHQNVSILGGTTLTIAPGTTVQMDPGVVLYINGQLIANGSSAQPITFDRSGSSGSWNSLLFQSGSSGTVQLLRI